MGKYFHIYQIKNDINDKVYIGSAVDVFDRWHLHKKQLNANIHHSIKLQRAWNKYGSQSFSFEIVEVLTYKKDLIPAEQAWIDFCRSYKYGYNCCPTAGSQLGHKWSVSSRKKLSESKKGKPSNRKGCKLSQETKDKLSAINKGKKMPQWVKDKMKGRVVIMTPEAKRAISVSRGLKNYYSFLREDGSIVEMNMFKDYCVDNGITFKVLHAWSINNRDGLVVHPLFKIKILKLTVKND